MSEPHQMPKFREPATHKMPELRVGAEFKAIRALLELNGWSLRKKKDSSIYEATHADRGSLCLVFLDAAQKWASTDLPINTAIQSLLSIKVN